MVPATRKQRLLAVAIDCALVMLISLCATSEGLPEAIVLVALAAGAVLIGALVYLLAKYGQTPGKRIVGIKIVKQDTFENGGFVVNVLKRGFLPSLPYFFLMLLHPVVSAAYIWTDLLMIFRQDRRCLHDIIAGTIVIQASSDVVQ